MALIQINEVIMSEALPADIITYEQAKDEFHITIAQVRYLARKGAIRRYKRGQLKGVWVSRAEVAAAVELREVSAEEAVERPK